MYHSKKKKPKVMMKGGKPVVKMQKSGKSPEVKKADHSITDFSIPNEKAHGKNQLSNSPMKKGSSLSEDQKKKISENKSYKKGGKFPDLTGDGKVTQADILKGRGVFKKGGKTKKGGMAGLDAAEKQVYKRGLAAYMSSGNRPKVSQHAWAMARVKSAFGKREAAKIRAGKGGKKKK
tara:strand:- start:80 stop:610 length:531 start_codon:yes stop_codon:yes gene_type:complete